MNKFSLLEQRISQLFDQTDVSGVAIAIVEGKKISYANAFGELTLEEPLAVASLTKPIFAYAILKLWEQGILNLDKPLAEYLSKPYLSGEPYPLLITARHTLSHTTGFPNWRDESGLHTLFRPGSSFHYSTEGLIYLQRVIEHLIQQPLHKYLEHNIFEPFAMESSQLVPEDLSEFIPFLPSETYAYGALSLHTTVTDYARFLIEMGRVDKEDKFHLTRASMTEMLTPQVRVGNQRGLSWGLGWGIQHIDCEEDSFWHWGARRKLTRNIVIGQYTNQSGIVIFTNHGNGLTICEEIAQIGLEHPEPFPAFRWLLPEEKWRADGTDAE